MPATATSLCLTYERVYEAKSGSKEPTRDAELTRKHTTRLTLVQDRVLTEGFRANNVRE